ncbi:DUF4229 domain-containing protein [Pseudarthrobacter sp. P1]|uniref:DUF4229 domain-containing protein n=1 Tax=Pseudarthrobacter sp. P1 TaxID=3418418 RepID=UPI003CF09682
MAFFKYFLIRAALFVPLFVLFLFLGLGPILAVVFAAIIAFCLSYLFFRKQRDAATEQLRHRFSGNAKPVRSATELADADAEDALVDSNPGVAIDADAAPRNAASRNTAPTMGTAAPAADAAQVPREFLGQ